MQLYNSSLLIYWMAAPLELNKLQEFDRKLETNFQRNLEEVTVLGFQINK
jgi:hypothetical protein